MKAKILALSLSALLAIGTLAGCGAPKEGAPAEGETTKTEGTAPKEGAEATEATSTDGKTTLSFTWWGNQKRNEVTKLAVDKYMELNPNIEIKLEFTDWSGYWDKLAAMAAGGNLPDIIQQDYGYITQYQQSNQLADLSALVDKGLIKIDKIPEPILQSGMIGDKLYAISAGSNAPTMTFDADVVKEAGVEIPDHPTIDQMYQICQQVFDKTKVNAVFDGGLIMMQMIARANGTYLFDELKEGKTDSAKKHFELVEKFAKASFAISPDLLAEKNTDNIETKPIIDSTSWNDFPLSNQFIAIANNTGRNMEMCMYPTLDGATNESMFLKPSLFLSISETSKNKEEAAKFVDWFTNSIECNEILMAERGVPVNTDILEALKPKVDPITAKTFDFVQEVSKIAKPIDPPDPAGRGEIEALIKTAAENIRYGEVTPEQAATDLAQQAQKILAEAKN